MDLKNPDINPNMKKDPTGQSLVDGIDLRTIFSAMAAWWREITLGAFLAAVMGVMVIVVLGAVWPRYDASANVVIIRDTTQSDRDLEGQQSVLMGLIHQESVAKRVLERLRSDEFLGENQYTLSTLFRAISAEFVIVGSLARERRSSLIRIRAEAGSVEKALALANTWAEEYVLEINRQNEQEMLDLIAKSEENLGEAISSYDDAQRELEEAIRDSNVNWIQGKIDTSKSNIEQLSDIQNKIARTLIEGHIDSHIDLLDQYRDIHLRLNELLGVAESLRAQVESGGETGAASNVLAIVLFKAHAYAVTGALPNKLEIGLDNIPTAHANVADQSADMDAVIAALKDRIDRINQDILRQTNSLSARMLIEDMEDDPPIQSLQERTQDVPNFAPWNLPLQFLKLEDYSHDSKRPLMRHVEKIGKGLSLLQMQLEVENSKVHNLKERRDLAHSYLQNILTEKDRVRLELSISQPILRLASPATTDGVSLWPSPVPVAAVSGVAGLLVMLLFAFWMDSIDVRPFLKRRGAEHTVRAGDP